jgi:hypothetical protein
MVDTANFTALREAELLGPVFRDPVSNALDAARRRAIHTDYVAEKQETKAAEARAEATAAREQYERLQAAVAAGKARATDYPQDWINRDYGREAQAIYIAENEAEIEVEKEILELALARTGLDEHGFRFPHWKFGTWYEGFAVQRLRRTPRERLDRKVIAESIRAGLHAHAEAILSGASAEQATERAFAAYRAGIGDPGVLENEKRTRTYWAMQAGNAALAQARAENRPRNELQRVYEEALAGILVEGCDRLELSTGPPT